MHLVMCPRLQWHCRNLFESHRARQMRPRPLRGDPQVDDHQLHLVKAAPWSAKGLVHPARIRQNYHSIEHQQVPNHLYGCLRATIELCIDVLKSWKSPMQLRPRKLNELGRSVATEKLRKSMDYSPERIKFRLTNFMRDPKR